MSKIKGVLVNANENGNRIEKHTAEIDSYTDYYKLLDCRVFDIQQRYVGDFIVDIYLDDEGLLKEAPIPTAITVDKNEKIVEVLFGNLFFTQTDPEGETVSLSDEAINAVLESQTVIFYKGSFYNVVRLNL